VTGGAGLARAEGLAVGVADGAGGDPVPVAPAVGGAWPGELAPQPASRAATMSAAAIGARRNTFMPNPPRSRPEF